MPQHEKSAPPHSTLHCSSFCCDQAWEKDISLSLLLNLLLSNISVTNCTWVSESFSFSLRLAIAFRDPDKNNYIWWWFSIKTKKFNDLNVIYQCLSCVAGGWRGWWVCDSDYNCINHKTVLITGHENYHNWWSYETERGAQDTVETDLVSCNGWSTPTDKSRQMVNRFFLSC